MRHIGLFGGTFDPIHRGHMLAAKSVLSQLQLDEIRFLPVAHSPFKPRPEVSDAHRVEMLNIAIEGNHGLSVDTRELQRPGPSYTIDTLAELTLDHSNDRLYLLIGMDAWLHFERWHHWRDVVKYCHLVVMSRPGFASPAIPEYWKNRQLSDISALKKTPAGKLIFMMVPACDAASSTIREQIRRGHSTGDTLIASTGSYIEQHKLYR